MSYCSATLHSASHLCRAHSLPKPRDSLRFVTKPKTMESAKVGPRNIPSHVQLAATTSTHSAQHFGHVQGTYGFRCYPTADAGPKLATPSSQPADEWRKRGGREPAAEKTASRVHGHPKADTSGPILFLINTYECLILGHFQRDPTAQSGNATDHRGTSSSWHVNGVQFLHERPSSVTQRKRNGRWTGSLPTGKSCQEAL